MSDSASPCEENQKHFFKKFFEPKKRKYPGFRKNVYDYFTTFCNNTGIHGFKYMGEQERSIVEKLYWIVLFGFSLYICIFLILNIWMKWDRSPVLVSFAQSPTPIWQIPFPAITICPETKARQRVYNVTDYYHRVKDNDPNLTAEELKTFADSSLICDNHLYTEGNATTSFDIIKYLFSLAPQFEEVFFECKWGSVKISCDTLFSPIVTEDGLCFTFNMLDKSEFFTNEVYLPEEYMGHNDRAAGHWTLENGYEKNTGKETFPRRAMSAGSKSGLFLNLRAFQQDLDYVCRGPVQGFKILLHHPAETPRMGSQYFRAPLNKEIVVGIKPDMITTSKGLRSYDPHRRHCFFANERSLHFFQNYTQQKCQVECLINHTLSSCGCVGFYMPHEEFTNICGSGNRECTFSAEAALVSKQVESGISNFENTANNLSKPECDCLPSCTSINYNAEISQADYNWPKVFEALKMNFSENPGLQMTRITLFFKEMQFIPSERNELYGQTDFLANCGGLLGLFTGFSFLSIIEIIYFLSLRLVCNVKKYGVHYWSGSKTLLEDDAYIHK